MIICVENPAEYKKKKAMRPKKKIYQAGEYKTNIFKF